MTESWRARWTSERHTEIVLAQTMSVRSTLANAYDNSAENFAGVAHDGLDLGG